ncbi:YdiU family protein [Vibrio sp. 404]|uniref:Protein nucleotidyltransferase YdiU n=1 Tax=Vibrio marinisediminis TaxID=2758441 RepID=A0A7W2FPL8_9VIBR|nr:YdiU family protein [Vibrio marinisediminis]MBA5761921.1 YdiU family protein [Vibrio marinisediminis]
MANYHPLVITNRFAQLPACFYRDVTPQPLDNTRWVMWNSTLAIQFGLPENAPLGELKQQLSGEVEHPQFSPLAMKYAGHQFGVYNPDLGDGRGLLLGELTDAKGSVFDLHLKGAGLTPYSRMGDGRAVLRSTIREYLCSEAMAGLGIATTRALGMLVSDTPVYREKQERGALLLRMAESHVRFGHFEYLFYTNQLAELKLLADKVIEWYWPQLAQAENPYIAMFEQVVDTTALMIAQWQAVGFCHGVMNTDNMSIIGQTFDYGPFAFLDDYDPSYICNHSDYQGRYAFNRQPSIALWNLSALGHALSAIIDKSDIEQQLAQYEIKLQQYYSRQMRAKLGLNTTLEEDGEFFVSLFELLEKTHVDYPRFMRELSNLDHQSPSNVIDLFVDRDSAKTWLERYLLRASKEVDENGNSITAKQRCEQMRKVNPKYVFRNYLAQQAIDKAERGDFSEVQTLAKLLAAPYDEHSKYESYDKLPPEWGKGMEISCSS